MQDNLDREHRLPEADGAARGVRAPRRVDRPQPLPERREHPPRRRAALPAEVARARDRRACCAPSRSSPTGRDRYRAENAASGHGVVFGGQLLGQAIVAALAGQDGKAVKTVHTIFARAAAPDAPLAITVDRMHAGRTFASSAVTIEQGGRLCTRSLVLLSAPTSPTSSATPSPRRRCRVPTTASPRRRARERGRSGSSATSTSSDPGRGRPAGARRLDALRRRARRRRARPGAARLRDRRLPDRHRDAAARRRRAGAGAPHRVDRRHQPYPDVPRAVCLRAMAAALAPERLRGSRAVLRARRTCFAPTGRSSRAFVQDGMIRPLQSSGSGRTL